MKKSILISAIMVSFLSACKKESDQNIPAATGSSVVSLNDYVKADSSGNYWVYDASNIDSNGNVITSWYDSAFVANDSVINGNTYRHAPNYIFLTLQNYLRDSAGFLVNHTGDLFLKVTGLPDTISITSTPEKDEYRFCERYPGSFTTPAGTFTDVIKTTIHYYMKPPFDTSFNPMHAELFFAKNVGLIQENFVYYFPATLGQHSERVLTGYYVQ